MPTNPLSLGRKMKPTQKHRPAVWECMLGAVYANDGTRTRYFDYDWEGALAYAGVTSETDPRTWPFEGTYTVRGTRLGAGPSRKQRVLYVKEN